MPPEILLPFYPPPPRPIVTQTARMEILGQSLTAISRRWESGDSGPDGRCKRCGTCGAWRDACLLLTNRDIAEAEAPDFSPKSHGHDVEFS